MSWLGTPRRSAGDPSVHKSALAPRRGHIRPTLTARAPGPARTTVVATMTLVVTLMPVFVLATSVELLPADLGVNEARLGVAVALFFTASGASGVAGGRLAQRIGAQRTMRAAAALSAVSLVLVPLVVAEWHQLLAVMMVAGVSNGIGLPAVTLSVSAHGGSRRGLMLGVQQSGAPVATMLTGAAVPIVGLTLGWRWSFALAAALALVVGLAIPRIPHSVSTPEAGLRVNDAPTGLMVVLAAATAVAASAGTALPSFLVPSVAASGLSFAAAGWLLVVASVAGIAVRLMMGWYADQLRHGHLHLVAGMMALGSVGFVLLGAQGETAVVVGGVVAYACGWGWPGVLIYAIIRLNPVSPAVGYGIVHVGAAGGAALGPVVFGMAVARSSYAAAWIGTAAVALTAAILIGMASTRLPRL